MLRKRLKGVCVGCGRHHALTARTERCDCARGENIAVRHHLSPAVGEALRIGVEEGLPSLWRYAPLLPLDPPAIDRLQVGWTPLLDVGQQGPAHLFLKDETRLPSGSIKDRASEIVVAVAVAHGIDEVIVASTGNAAASLACIGAAAGIGVTVLVPDTVPSAKLAQAVAYGARVHRVAGRYEDAFAMAAMIARETGAINRGTGLNPFTREGKKTCAFEIAEQLGWRAPDWVIVPTGDGNILSALWQGFCELKTLGWLDVLPRLVAVQSTASPPIANLHNQTPLPLTTAHRTDADPTIAESIAIPHPRDVTSALAALAESGGMTVTVDDAEIIAGMFALSGRFGVFAEPSSAAAFAAFVQLSDAGTFHRGERIICLITGTGLKDVRPVIASAAFREQPAIAPLDWRQLIPSPSGAR